jgi:transposase-like protein
MSKQNKFSPEVRECAVRLIQEHRGEYPSPRAAVESIAPKIGCVPATLLDWVKRNEVDSGMRDGMTSCERMKALEREIKKYMPISTGTGTTKGSSRSARCCRLPHHQRIGALPLANNAQNCAAHAASSMRI